MTYCLGIKVKEGLVCLADGRLTSGTQASSAGKISRHVMETGEFLIMTSGLRSIRDKVISYLNDAIEDPRYVEIRRLRDALNIYAMCLRQVAGEDRAALTESGLHFDLHAIFAGQLSDDPEPSLFLVYPEGNWIEVTTVVPYFSVGSTPYGKPLLDRALSYETSLEDGLKIAYLAFDQTRIASVDVGFPLDVVTFAGDRVWREEQFTYEDLQSQSAWWKVEMTKLAHELAAEKLLGPLLP